MPEPKYDPDPKPIAPREEDAQKKEVVEAGAAAPIDALRAEQQAKAVPQPADGFTGQMRAVPPANPDMANQEAMKVNKEEINSAMDERISVDGEKEEKKAK